MSGCVSCLGVSLAALATMFAASSPGSAQGKWERLPASGTARRYWRPDSVEAEHPTVWLRTDYDTARRAASTRFDRDEQRFAVDCRQRRVLWLSTLLFLRGQFVLRDHREPELAESWEDAARHPGLPIVLRRVCVHRVDAAAAS